MVSPTTKQVRHFHETILDIISPDFLGFRHGFVLNPSVITFITLLWLIQETKITKGHDEIIAAIDRCLNSGVFYPYSFAEVEGIRKVKEMVLAQKSANAAEVESKKKVINLDDLQQETETLLNLLQDRRPGLMIWNIAMRDCLQRLHQLISHVSDE